MRDTSANNCVHCGLCKRNCLFLEKYNIDLETFTRHPELAYSCFLCGRCKEVCPKGIDGADIALQMRKMKPDRESYRGILWEKNPYKFANYSKGKKKSVLFPGCNFMSFYPKTTKCLERLMKKHDIGIVYDCCEKPVYELGYEEDAVDNLKKLEFRLKEQSVEELIILCPNCYHFFKGKIDIPMVTIYKKLKELGEGYVFKKEYIPVYYPCPDRKKKKIFGELSVYLDGIIEEPFADVQCCGLGGCAGVREPELAKQMAQMPVLRGQEELYTYCASCVSNFRRKGMEKAYHVLPLILGVEEEMPLGIRPFVNRAKRKIF